LLYDHVNGVHRLALKLFDDVRCNFPDFDRHDLRKTISVVALFHDFGKATSFFQNYIEDPKAPSTDSSRMRRRHGLISAIAVYQILRAQFPGDSLLPLLGFIVVRKHHGNLQNYRNLLLISEEDLGNCLAQAEHLEYDELRRIYFSYAIDRDLIAGFSLTELRSFRRKDREFFTEHYFVLNLLYSLLLHADKTDAILHEDSPGRPKLMTSESIRCFKKSFEQKPQNSINAIREKAFRSVNQAIDTLDDTERILSVNIPTGSGKTITSLNAALKLCEKYGHDHVVYCLPFTSVIDQNFQVFDDIRKTAGLPEESGLLLKHHHLTDIRYQVLTDENAVKEYGPNEALHLIEGWQSRIIVTTFVQFMYSLISYQNASLRKFHRFSNAVIILDEIQSIPHHYWKLINHMLSRMTQWLNSRIILVTATMPLIFSEQEKEIKELVSQKREMFLELKRIELDVSHLNEEKMEWADFCESAKTVVCNNPDKDILFVMNTIRCARDLYTLFSEADIPHRLEYLSSHIIPTERLRRIERIKNRDEDRPTLVVSTQLVEAGVDIDLDIVVRDFAPLDSIFQTCGRCNRENRNGVKGKVILFSIKDSNGWTPANIYSSFLMQKTKKVLEGKINISESQFFQLANDYFNEVQAGGSQTLSDDLLEKIAKLKYCDNNQRIEIKLIEDDYSSSVYIEYNEEAAQIWERYQQTLTMENGFEKSTALQQIRRKLAEYMINVPRKCVPPEDATGIYRIPRNDVQKYYDPQTGFDPNAQLPEKTETIIL